MKRASSVLLAVALVIPALFVCTEAYAADKAVSYRGSTYNVANVTKTSSRVDGEAMDPISFVSDTYPLDSVRESVEPTTDD